ncbi:MAG TPA: maleylpyruvate isomerase family mycothiol-dependent enzyme [Acidimicrobiales bacterium]|nr:maleylpyruvate isomerase family mycothiol-dependent enzyme [Acidimicrobiales bacterium]
MDVATHLTHLKDHSAALLAAYRSDPTAAVASCPGWDRTALLSHVARVHARFRAQLAAGPDEYIGFKDAPLPPEGDELPEWFATGAAALVEAISVMDLDLLWPTWAGPRPGAWIPRRMAQETALHRWDADPSSSLDGDLAADGIDEHLTEFAPRLPASPELPDATIHLHATDRPEGDGEWLVTLSPEGIRAERGHAKGHVAVRATAADLLLWVWNRVEPTDEDRFQVFGEPGLLAAWARVVRF